VYEKLLRPLLFRLDAEQAHNLGMWVLARGLIRTRLMSDPRLQVSCMGLTFPNPIGLAAGLDKNGVAASRWGSLGFGFAELGTVTPEPQPGNDKPRLFRIPSEKAIINRMGFNNEGAVAMAERLRGVQSSIPLGINLGKNKVTEAADAPSDYEKAFRVLNGRGSYFVINVSSPNTPGLRALQEKGALLDIVDAMHSVTTSRPILIKVAPDLNHAELDDVVSVVMEKNLAGLIATNTTLDRSMLRTNLDQAGGLSGAPLLQKSNDICAYVRSVLPAEKALIGVGGIFTADDVRAKLATGANLVQMYTGWVYGGPMTVPRILTEMLTQVL